MTKKGTRKKRRQIVIRKGKRFGKLTLIIEETKEVRGGWSSNKDIRKGGRREKE